MIFCSIEKKCWIEEEIAIKRTVSVYEIEMEFFLTSTNYFENH
jgi:hypothetical protein